MSNPDVPTPSQTAPEEVKNSPAAETSSPTPPRRSRLRRWLRGIGITVLILLILLAVIFIFRDPIIKFSACRLGSLVTGTRLELAEFNSSLDGKVELRDFRLDNPPGYRQTPAIEFDLISVRLDMSTLFKPMLVIDEVTVRGVHVNFESRIDGSSNLTDIQNNVGKFLGSGPETEESREEEIVKEETAEATAPDSAAAEGGQSVLIRVVNFENNSLSISSATFNTTVPVPLVNLKLTNVGGEGQNWGEVLDKLYVELLKLIQGPLQNIGGVVLDIGNQAGETLIKAGNQAGETLVRAGNEAGQKLVDAGNEAGQKLVDAGSEAGKSLLNFLKPSKK